MCRVAEVNTHGNRHRGLCLQPLCKKRGRRRKGVSDKGTVCSVGKNKAAGGREQQQSGTDGHPHPLVFSTSQSKATVCEKSIFQSYSAPLKPQGKKKETRAGLTYFKNKEACQRRHRHQRRRFRQRGQNESWTEMSRGKNCSSLDSWEGDQLGDGQTKKHYIDIYINQMSTDITDLNTNNAALEKALILCR